MQRKHELKCRIQGCEKREQFQTVDSVNESDWSEVSPMSIMNGDGYLVHQAYCPGHSFDE